VSLGPFFRVENFSEFGFAGTLLDPVSPGGMSWNLGIEFSPLMRFRFLIEWSLLHYWTDQPELFRYMLDGWGSDWFAIEGNRARSWANFRIGCRVLL